MKKIILTGGGTAGHVIPNIALIPMLRKAGYRIYYIGSTDGIERELIEPYKSIKYFPISSGKLRRYIDAKNISDPFRIFKGLCQSMRIIKDIKPSVVFSKGGFVSVPVVIAAKLHKIPIVIHESDITSGLANKISRPLCTTMCTTFQSAALNAGHKGVATGSPVRPEILHGDPMRGMILCGFERSRPILLIMGGSSGAQAINECIDSSMDELLEHFQIVHIRGKNNFSKEFEGRGGYRQYTYVREELPHLMACADVVLSRAGANAIFEFAALNKPMLLIPLPLASSRGDQILNASYFKSKGLARVLSQEKMTSKKLVSELVSLYEKRLGIITILKASDTHIGLEKLFAEIMKASK